MKHIFLLLPLSACVFCLFCIKNNFAGLLLISDHTLVRHDINKTVVVDEFECLHNCMENNKCKSLNVHYSGNKSEVICEINNKTRQMAPDAFQRQQRSTYYGAVEVSGIRYIWLNS